MLRGSTSLLATAPVPARQPCLHALEQKPETRNPRTFGSFSGSGFHPWGHTATRSFAAAASAGKQKGRGSVKAPAATSDAPVSPIVENIEDLELHVEAKNSYLAYAMSVIVGRALPDVRDGLKPVHRRILFAMNDLGLTPNKPFKKSARVVGEVLGKYHPHGDTAVYDALVRLAQPFSMRDPLINGHGNFGSLDDDPAAAMRYTECRLQQITSDMLLADMDADTVDFLPTFDASQTEPTVLPAKVPHLLVNGTSGIAVGIATRIPPHNMQEVVAGLLALIKNPDITTKQLMEYIPAPDFPTGGQLVVGAAMEDAYTSGSGYVTLRATVSVEDAEPPKLSKAKAPKAGKSKDEGGGAPTSPSQSPTKKALLVISEMPYQVNKADLVCRIAELVETKIIDGVSDVRDESDRDGTRVVVELRRGFSPDVVIAQLFKHTKLEGRFSCNMVALVDGLPQQMGLKEMLTHFLDFRCNVVERRGKHQLQRARARLTQVVGFLTAMSQIDAVIKVIRQAQDGAAAKVALVTLLDISDEQADAVLGLTLRRLTSLEKGSLESEKADLESRISDLESLLSQHERVLQIVEREAKEVAAKHGTPRRSLILPTVGVDDAIEALPPQVLLVPNRDVLLMFSSRGFVRRVLSDSFKRQTVKGKGKGGAGGAGLRSEDALEQVVAARERDFVLAIASSGRAYLIRAYMIPEPNKSGYGTAIAQVLGTSSNVPLVALLPIPEHQLSAIKPAVANTKTASTSSPAALSDGESVAGVQVSDPCIIMITQKGLIKKVRLTNQMTKMRKSGLAMMKVMEGDTIISAAICTEADHVMLGSSRGKVLIFPVSQIPYQATGSSRGVKAMKLAKDQVLVGMCIIPADTATRIPKRRNNVAADESGDEEGGDEVGEAAELAPSDSKTAGGTAELVPSGSNTAGETAELAPSYSRQTDGIGSGDRGPWALLITANGFAKRADLSNFRLQSRGATGMAGTLNKVPRSWAPDSLASISLVNEGDEVLVGSSSGKITRVSTSCVTVHTLLFATGLRLMVMDAGDTVQTVLPIPAALCVTAELPE